jgi:hypothetical protein
MYLSVCMCVFTLYEYSITAQTARHFSPYFPKVGLYDLHAVCVTVTPILTSEFLNPSLLTFGAACV